MEVATENSTSPVPAPGRISDALIGESRSIRDVREKIEVAARSDLPVLIEGETGTGKELAARRIHFDSMRQQKPLVTVDCSTIPENLLESELFGHGKGAFTGSVGRYRGRIDEADGGTLFFDEIGSVTPSVQAKLLRFLETGEFPRVREAGLRSVDTRLVAATSQMLERGVGEGRIRRDFFYRLSALHIWIPPLRDRMEDLPILAHHVLRRAGHEAGASLIEPDVMSALHDHDWPGNVRELRNALLVGMATSRTGRIGRVDLGPHRSPNGDAAGGEAPRSLRGYLEAREKEYLSELVVSRPGNLSELAAAADVSVRTLQRKFRYYNLRY